MGITIQALVSAYALQAYLAFPGPTVVHDGCVSPLIIPRPRVAAIDISEHLTGRRVPIAFYGVLLEYY